MAETKSHQYLMKMNMLSQNYHSVLTSSSQLLDSFQVLPVSQQVSLVMIHLDEPLTQDAWMAEPPPFITSYYFMTTVKC